MRRVLTYAGTGWLLSLLWAAMPLAATPQTLTAPQGVAGADLFTASKNCIACHNGLTTPDGKDVSIGIAWRATMMANSARDPYWQASVRRETIDHPTAGAAIEDECSICHMPMSHTAAHASGGTGQVFAHLPARSAAGRSVAPADPMSELALDGVSCALCHQITPKNLGTPASYTGGYVIDTSIPPEQRPIYGPYPIDAGLRRIMHSVTGFEQTEGAHIRQAELCATCHTLITKALGPDGEEIGRLPEQVPFQEWQHSRYASEQSCQDCHMPAMGQPTPIASVLGQPREGAKQHTFVGGNFFILRMLNRFRAELGVAAEQHEMEASAAGTLDHLRASAAHLTIDRAAMQGGRLVVDVTVENLTGHKLPTAYPSRRAWIHLTVRDASGTDVFSSGAVSPSGAIAGNDNDANPLAFEPHYRQITSADQVQIYESILGDSSGAVTTGLLKAVRYLKDNRVLPHGFDKATAEPDIAVHGDAAADQNFVGGTDSVQYSVDVAGAQGALTVTAELLYEPIGFRWADNLRPYKADEPARFAGYYDSMAGGTAAPLARATSTVAR